MKVKVKLLDEKASLPAKATEGSACYDVFSKITGSLGPNATFAFPTGLVFELPRNYEIEIRPRSSLAQRGVVIANSPGTLDSDYRGELRILLRNLSREVVTINEGDRIAQIKVNRIIPVEFELVEVVGMTVRGEGGFGSTGK